MFCTLDCSQKVRIALKPGTRSWSPYPASTQSTGSCWPPPECTLTHVQLPKGSAATAQVQGPSLYTLEIFWWGQVLGFGTSPGVLEDQDKGGHQHWIHTTLLMGSWHKTEPGCTAWPCSHPATLRLPLSHTRQQALLWIALQGLQGNLHLPSAQ